MKGIALVGAFAGVVCFYGLGANGLHELDEAWHAQVAIEVARDGTWWSPTLFGKPYFDKPMLGIWLMALDVRLVGPTPLAFRFWAAAFAVGAVVGTALLGRRVGGSGVGALAALALTTAYPFVYTHSARTAALDSMMVFFFVLATLLFVSARQSGRGWIACAVAAALASHAKNFAGLLPAAVFAIELLLVRDGHRPSRRQWAAAALAFVGIHCAWLLPMAWLHGEPFLRQFALDQVLQRPDRARFAGIDLMERYARVIGFGFFPWVVPAVFGAGWAAAQRWRGDAGATTTLLIWVVVLAVVLMVLLPAAHLWYATPMFPFLAVLAAHFLLDDRMSRWVACAGALATVATAVLLSLHGRDNPFVLWSVQLPVVGTSPPLRALGVAAVAGLALVVALRGGNRPWRASAIAACVVAGAVNVLPGLAWVDYRNPLVEMREGIAVRRRPAESELYVGLQRIPGNLLVRHYLANVPGFTTRFEGAPETALRAARRGGDGPVVLVERPRDRVEAVGFDVVDRIELERGPRIVRVLRPGAIDAARRAE